MAESFFTFAPDVRPICEIGISETRQAEPTSWFDVSCHVHQAELFRGRERFTDRFEPGTASVTFGNDDGWADLGGTYADVAAAELRPGRQIRIGVHGTWTPGLAPFTRWLYRGFIDQATPAYDPVRHDTVTVLCIDALGEAGQTTAPTAEHQGVNETAANRINRVLDAVGWWSVKRKVDATATTVQGTELGAQAIDHMGQAADSAGGVVFGDLDGDVVFRDIDWMLYDPDVPPDGTVGPGDPGAPPGDTPPYIDPTPGPVYDPDDPPAVTPPKVCVCADGTAGTLVEKGDNYRLYVRDGHLFYESSGTTWDLGPYSGGCTCVDPTGGDGPERSDDPDEDGDYDISPFPPIELPPVFGVELLAWHDAGLADPPASSVTVTGVAPGHDCLLVVLVNALGALTNTVGLAPIFDGGGLDWAHRRDADQTGDGASSFIALAPVGRDDPGTFDVTVTWTAPSTSRTHIVTVWKVTAPAAGYLERFDAGAVLYATTDSNPPDEIEPGDGFHVVDLAADRQPRDVDVLTRPVDITIAQSLAEEGTGPFGAVLAESNGPWVLEPGGTVATLAAVFSDDFERTGSLGAPDWELPTGMVTSPTDIGGFDSAEHHDIVDGEAVGVMFSGTVSTFPMAVDFWTGSDAADHSVEATFTFPGSGPSGVAGGDWSEVWFLMLFDPDAWTGVAADMLQSADGFRLRFNNYVDGVLIDSSYDYDHVWEGASHAVTMRFEATTAGVMRAFIGATLVNEYEFFEPAVGTRFGMASRFWQRTGGGGALPTIDSVTFGTADSRKTSWVAGWRVGAAYPNVILEDVNTGVDDVQSAQACLVVESPETAAGWQVLGYDLRAELTGTTPAGTLAFTNPPRPGSFVVVMVGVTAATDVIGAVAVTGADFTAAVTRNRTGSSWGQGAVFTAAAPLDFALADWAVVVTHPEVQSISVVVYEVTGQSDISPVGVTASGTLGTNTAGSVNGASSITLSGAGDAAAVVLASLHAAADASLTSGAGTVDGDEWHEELQYSPSTDRVYLQSMSRAPGQPESTSTDVHWDDVQTGTASTYSAVQLAVEIRPTLDPLDAVGPTGVWLGGVTDPWNGTIDTAGAYNADGTPIWEFP